MLYGKDLTHVWRHLCIFEIHTRDKNIWTLPSMSNALRPTLSINDKPINTANIETPVKTVAVKRAPPLLKPKVENKTGE
jgi:hypothetical protein